MQISRPPRLQPAPDRVLFVCQEAFRVVFWVVVRVGWRVVVLVRVREWLVRRAGVLGCEPVTLDLESFPFCPPGPAFSACERRASTTRAA
jgi:hypothetical protein